MIDWDVVLAILGGIAAFGYAVADYRRDRDQNECLRDHERRLSACETLLATAPGQAEHNALSQRVAFLEGLSKSSTESDTEEAETYE